MKKNLYEILFPKEVDERIDTGSVITLETDTEYVVLGFEVCGVFCNAIIVSIDEYLKVNPLLQVCPLGIDKMSFIKQLDKKETLAYYTKLKLLGINHNLKTREQIKEQSKDVTCKSRYDIDLSKIGCIVLFISILTLLVLLVVSLLTKIFFLFVVSVLCILVCCISLISCHKIIKWERIDYEKETV